MDGSPAETEPFDVEAINPRYGTARMSDVALAVMRPQDPKVAAIIEARRDEPSLPTHARHEWRKCLE